METIIFLGPVARVFAVLCGVMGVLAMGGYIITIIGVILEPPPEEEVKQADRLLRAFRNIFLACVLVGVPAGVAGSSWKMYQQVLAYRAINSDTAEKVVENIDKLLDLTSSRMEDIIDEKLGTRKDKK